MAVRFMDSFDHYGTAQLGDKYDVVANSPAIASGRFGNGFFADAGSSPRQVTKILDNQPTWIIGFAARFAEITQSTSTIFLRLFDGATNQVDLRRISSGFIRVTRNGTTLADASTPLSNNVWFYIEFKVTINNSGSFELRMDGVNVASGSADTDNSGNARVDRFMLSGIQQTGADDDFWADDLYVLDGTTGAGSNPCNDFLGDMRIECLFPNGNGYSSHWVGSDANSTDNYLLVDEPSPDEDTTYVESSNVSDIDAYTCTNLASASGSIYAVQPIMRAKKSDSGTRTVRNIARLSGTNSESASHTLSTSYRYLPSIFETKPGG